MMEVVFFYWNPYPHTDKSIPLIHTPCIPSRNTRIKMPSRISGQDLAWSQPQLPSWLSLQFEFPYSALISIAPDNFSDFCRPVLIKIDFVINTYFDHNKEKQVWIFIIEENLPGLNLHQIHTQIHTPFQCFERVGAQCEASGLDIPLASLICGQPASHNRCAK